MATRTPARTAAAAAQQVQLAAIADAAQRGYPFYVYTLSDAAGVFYVGKGSRSRLFHHGGRHDTQNQAKVNRITAAGPALMRTVVGYFATERAALDCERAWIRDLRDGLTNITRGGHVQDPVQNAREAFRQMLDRAVPLDQWRKPARCPLPETEARALYALTLEHIRREAENPTPPYLLVRSNGEVRTAWR